MNGTLYVSSDESLSRITIPHTTLALNSTLVRHPQVQPESPERGRVAGLGRGATAIRDVVGDRSQLQGERNLCDDGIAKPPLIMATRPTQRPSISDLNDACLSASNIFFVLLIRSPSCSCLRQRSVFVSSGEAHQSPPVDQECFITLRNLRTQLGG